MRAVAVATGIISVAVPQTPLLTLLLTHFYCSGSDSVENAEKEISLWFPEGTVTWASASKPWVYEV